MFVSISDCKWNAETGNTWIGSKPTQNWTSDTESWRGYAQAGVRKHVFTLRKKADPGLPSCLFWRNWNHSAAKQVPNFCRKVAFFFLETKVGLLGTSPWEQPSGEFMEVPGPFNTSTGEQSKARREWVKCSGQALEVASSHLTTMSSDSCWWPASFGWAEIPKLALLLSLLLRKLKRELPWA